MSATGTTAAAVRKAYRDLYHILRHTSANTKVQQSQREKQLQELRQRFREPLGKNESIEQRLKQATDRASFLRITTVKTKPRGESGTWIYKDGQCLQSTEEGGGTTLRDDKGRVISNWDGKNLDPCSVKRHRQQLNRAGFVNNWHAKGVF
jgi:hypothetical protein